MPEFKFTDGRLLVEEDDVTLHFEGFGAHGDKKKLRPRTIPRSQIERAEVIPMRGFTAARLRLHVLNEPAWGGKPERDPSSFIALGKAEQVAHEAARLLNGHPAPGATPEDGAAEHWAGDRPDIRAAADRMGFSLGSMREVKKLPEHLRPDETVSMLCGGRYENDIGIVVLTSRRLLFVFHGLMRQRIEDFPLDRISSVQQKSGMLLAELMVTASGNTAKIDQMQKHAAKALADALRDAIDSGSRPSSTQASASAGPDILDQIRKLGELRDAGVLTEDEFSSKKAALLERL